MNNIDIYENVQYAKDYVVNLGYELAAENEVQYDFVQVALGVEKVRKAVCYNMANGEVLVGVLTEPLFSLSERLTLGKTIENTVAEITGKNVYVTLDTDLFVQISKCKDDAKGQEIKRQIIVRNNARM